VGYGKITPDGFKRILESRRRNASGPSAPAHGLCLKSIRYPDEVLLD
jgi:tRNA pseudouridine38-40 synthase